MPACLRSSWSAITGLGVAGTRRIEAFFTTHPALTGQHGIELDILLLHARFSPARAPSRNPPLTASRARASLN
ncbi:hypothetical protein C5O80_12905 [Burkholderia sp. SRS-46]|nr:hypothetical protein C5O80_12905 [Burkholderia sp. SRS-46]